MMNSNRNSNKRGRAMSGNILMASPPGNGSFCDYAMVQSDSMGVPVMQPMTFQQPASFSSALLGTISQPPMYPDHGHQMFQQSYHQELFDNMEMGQGQASGSVESASGFSIDAASLCAFGITDVDDQMRITRMFQFLCDISYGSNMCDSIGRMLKYMKSYTASSTKINDAKEALELEKQKLVADLEAKDMEITAVGIAKDQYYQPRIEALENDLRQKGLDIENLQSTNTTHIERLQRDCEAAREEMDRVQRICEQKDLEIAVLRKQNNTLQSASDGIISLRERVAELEGQNALLVQARNLSQPLVDNINNIREYGIFHDRNVGDDVICPIMCSSGVIASMKTVVAEWAKSGGGCDGNVERTFKCFETGKDVMVVSRPVFESIWTISTAMGINMETPCTFEYSVNGSLVTFPVYDVLAIASRVCKIYRDGCGDEEKMMMLKGGTLVMFNLSDAEDSSRKRLSFAVQKMVPGSTSAVYPGIFRITDRSWDPFGNMDFIGV